MIHQSLPNHRPVSVGTINSYEAVLDGGVIVGFRWTRPDGVEFIQPLPLMVEFAYSILEEDPVACDAVKDILKI